MKLVLKIISAILLLSVVIGLSVAVCGCQSPSTVYTNGLIVWCSASAVGIGWGEYAEVAAGGKLTRSTTNDVAAIIGDGRNYLVNTLTIVPPNHTKQAGGADLP